MKENLSGTPFTFTTDNANDILVAAARTGGTDSADGAFTTTQHADFLGMAYQIVTATQSGSTLTWGGSTRDCVGDAIVKG